MFFTLSFISILEKLDFSVMKLAILITAHLKIVCFILSIDL